MDSDNSSFLLAIHQIRPGEQEAYRPSCDDSYKTQYFDPHSFIRNLPDVSGNRKQECLLGGVDHSLCNHYCGMPQSIYDLFSETYLLFMFSLRFLVC